MPHDHHKHNHDYSSAYEQTPEHIAQEADVVSYLSKHLPLGEGAKILDIGAGTGGVVRKLGTNASMVVANDTFPGVAKFYSEDATPRVVLDTRDLLDPATAAYPTTFTAVLSVMTFHHLPLAPSLAAIRTMLVPGGQLAIVDLMKEDGFFHGKDVPHHGFHPKELSGEMEKAGFEILRVDENAAMRRKHGSTYEMFGIIAKAV